MDRHYKVLLYATLLMFVGAIAFLFFQYATTGEFIAKGVSLKGGLSLTALTTGDVDVPLIERALQQAHPSSDIVVRRITEAGSLKAIIVEATDMTEDEVLAVFDSTRTPYDPEGVTAESIGTSLGESFFRQTIIAMVMAFLAMSLVVLITFRSFLPSLFVILAAVADIVETLAIASFLEIRLSTAGIAAFLMLIGYSVDTDILLTSRVMHRKEGTVVQAIHNAMRTGLTMTLTATVAVTVGYFFTQSDTIKQIMLILLIGLLLDVLNTWIQNAGILRWYMDRKEQRGAKQ